MVVKKGGGCSGYILVRMTPVIVIVICSNGGSDSDGEGVGNSDGGCDSGYSDTGGLLW